MAISFHIEGMGALNGDLSLGDNQLLQCLEVRSVTPKNISGDTYIFQVEFSNPDGSLFVLGPCCGATETEMPPVSQLEYTVSRNAEHRYVVMNPPPYVP